MHLQSLTVDPATFPTRSVYPFNLPLWSFPLKLQFTAPVTFLVGDNGTGKSTLLKALALKCAIPIWSEPGRRRLQINRYEEQLQQHLKLDWAGGPVSGSYFAAELFRTFVQILDEWAVADPEMLQYFGGESLVTKSHGQGNFAYFKSRYQRPGLHLLDEPETALSPRKQLELGQLLQQMGQSGQAQFLVATHSPLLLALPQATIFNFDTTPVQPLAYQESEYYQVYRDFFNNNTRHGDRKS